MANDAETAVHLLSTLPQKVRKMIPRQISTTNQLEVRFADDLPVAAVYGGDGMLCDLWDAETLKPLPRVLYGPPTPWHIILHKFADEATCSPVSKVYFIGGDSGFIKIGFTVDLPGRLRAIQSCSPIPLRVLATRNGGQDREVAYHSQFREHRQHGEWFERHPNILAEIERLNA